LEHVEIDRPIIDVVRAFNRLPHCFTLQSCYGHFLWSPCQGPYNLERLPSEELGGLIEYRIAYLALCLDNSETGRALLRDLKLVVRLDPDCVQFGSADWFWAKQVNSYVLQVEPLRFQDQDHTTLAFQEARHIECVRGRFFEALSTLVD